MIFIRLLSLLILYQYFHVQYLCQWVYLWKKKLIRKKYFPSLTIYVSISHVFNTIRFFQFRNRLLRSWTCVRGSTKSLIMSISSRHLHIPLSIFVLWRHKSFSGTQSGGLLSSENWNRKFVLFPGLYLPQADHYWWDVFMRK